MGKKTIKKPINQFLRRIPKEIHIENVVIFGSQSMNTAMDDSDIDVLVVSKDFVGWDEENGLIFFTKRLVSSCRRFTRGESLRRN